MAEQTSLISGCATGIGTATARLFHGQGWTVYATDPDFADLQPRNRLGCEVREPDVTDSDDAHRVDAMRSARGATGC